MLRRLLQFQESLGSSVFGNGVQPFVHARFGGATARVAGASDTGFAMFLGGGLDPGLTEGIGIRLVQADWLMTRFDGENQDRQGRVPRGYRYKVLRFELRSRGRAEAILKINSISIPSTNKERSGQIGSA